MKEINLPPFYVGQKVIGVLPNRFNKPEKDKIYTVLDIRQGCCEWEINVGISPHDPNFIECGVCKKHFQHNGTLWLRVSRFAPIQENFQEISYSEVVKEEKRLISVN